MHRFNRFKNWPTITHVAPKLNQTWTKWKCQYKSSKSDFVSFWCHYKQFEWLLFKLKSEFNWLFTSSCFSQHNSPSCCKRSDFCLDSKQRSGGGTTAASQAEDKSDKEKENIVLKYLCKSLI